MSEKETLKAKMEMVTPEVGGLDRFLSLSATLEIAGRPCRQTLWKWVAKGAFPAPVQVGPHRIGWRASDLKKWQESRPTVAWAPSEKAA